MIGAVAAVLAGPAAASADETRITVGFRPAQPQSPFAVEITNTGSRHALPSLKLSGNRSGLQLAGYNTLLPQLTILGLSVAPRYGDHRLAFDFQPSALAGLGLPPRTVRGLTLTGTGRRISGTLLIGRLVSGPSLNPFGSTVPSVLAFSATMKPQARVAISPRLVAPLGRRGGQDGADPAMGIGLRAEVSRNISIIGDVGSTRARNALRQAQGAPSLSTVRQGSPSTLSLPNGSPGGRWAQSATAGVLGRWSRASFEASMSHGDEGVTLLGTVPFAASDRTRAGARLLLVKGVTLEGALSAANAVGRSADRAIGRSAVLRVERFSLGKLMLQFDRSPTDRRQPQSVMIEWRQRAKSGMTLQWKRQSQGSGSSARPTRRLQIDVPRLPSASRRLDLNLQSSVLLSNRRGGDSRATTRIKGRLAAGAHLGLIGEADFDVLGPSALLLHKLTTGADFTISRSMSVQLTHLSSSGNRRPMWKRMEVRFTRSVAIK
jgi:hypothetical protein